MGQDEGLLMVGERLAVVAFAVEGRAYVVEGVGLAAAVTDIAVDAERNAIVFQRFTVPPGALAQVPDVVGHNGLFLPVAGIPQDDQCLLIVVKCLIVIAEMLLDVGYVV